MNIFLLLLHKRRFFAGGFCLLAAAGASAITLGPNTRSAVLGQPLDISVQMLLEAGDDPQALCLEASVFYADKQLDRSKVQIAAEKAASAQESLIRIRAVTPVEGPVVTVHLRAGCVQKTSRRYVVLAMAKPRSASDADNVVTVASMPGVPATGMPAATAPDSPQSADKIQALETELRQTRDELLKNQAALAESKSQLNIAQGERSKGLVYGVAGIVAFAFAGLSLLLLQRSGREQASGSRYPWWRRPKAATMGAHSELSALAPVSEAGRNLDIDESLFDELKRHSQRAPLESIPPLARRDRARFSVSVPFVPRTVKVPELFDLQQQVDFFTSLGQQEKAIALLREHLVNNVKTSALVYLDLLDLYHQAGEEEEYEILRADFNRVFSTDIAPYDSYSADGAVTQAYETVQARIEAVWPSRRVFGIIEDALFREPGNPAEVLDLEAYRELLLLYAVAREINELESGVSGMVDTQWPDLAMQPRSSPRLGLDIDLSQFSGRADENASSPQRGDRAHAGRRRTAPDRQTAAARDGLPANAGTGRVPLTPLEPTVLDSLVDFDDYDTGFRPDDFGKPTR